MTAIADPVVTVKELLEDNWDASNWSDAGSPNIHFGWYHAQATSPQITVTAESQDPVTNAAVTADGERVIQENIGEMNCDCWSTRDVSTTNPRQLTYEMAAEVTRIVNENYLTATDLRFVKAGQRRFIQPYLREEPTAFRYRQKVIYVYEGQDLLI